jgi:hypothetical protein
MGPRLKNLNGWQRLGIVLSFSWLLFIIIIILAQEIGPQIEPGVLITFLPIIAGWFGSYCFLWAFQWTKEGFDKNKEKVKNDRLHLMFSRENKYIIIGFIFLLVILWWTRWEYHTILQSDGSEHEPIHYEPFMYRSNRITGDMERIDRWTTRPLRHYDKYGHKVD